LGDLCDSKPFRNYFEIYKDFKLESKIPEFNRFLRKINKFIVTDNSTKIFEIGTGNGWFQILCVKNGLAASGIDVVPHNIEFANKLAESNGQNIDITLGSIEDTFIGSSEYDVIMAISVFEHVRDWKKGLMNSYNALKPNGILFFISTNKFSLISGEYRFPFYGWLPRFIRFKLRAWFQGKEALSYNLDFNQFNYFQLRRFFKKLGFSKIHDIWDIIDIDDFSNSDLVKIYAMKFVKNSKLLRKLLLWLLPITYFVCIK